MADSRAAPSSRPKRSRRRGGARLAACGQQVRVRPERLGTCDGHDLSLAPGRPPRSWPSPSPSVAHHHQVVDRRLPAPRPRSQLTIDAVRRSVVGLDEHRELPVGRRRRQSVPADGADTPAMKSSFAITASSRFVLGRPRTVPPARPRRRQPARATPPFTNRTSRVLALLVRLAAPDGDGGCRRRRPRQRRRPQRSEPPRPGPDAGDRGRGQARPFRAAEPRLPSSPPATSRAGADAVALERDRLDAVITGLLFIGDAAERSRPHPTLRRRHLQPRRSLAAESRPGRVGRGAWRPRHVHAGARLTRSRPLPQTDPGEAPDIPRHCAGPGGNRPRAFVDGTMRTEAPLTRTSPDGEVSMSLAGSWAPGAVLVDGEPARFAQVTTALTAPAARPARTCAETPEPRRRRHAPAKPWTKPPPPASSPARREVCNEAQTQFRFYSFA